MTRRHLRDLRRAAVALFAVVLGACSQADPPTAPNAMPLMADSTAITTEGVTGVFRRVRYAVSGTATLRVQGETAQLDFSPDFSVAGTPGPVVYLNTTNNPNTGRPLRIGPIQRLRGAQRWTFRVPAGVRYEWVIIWCDPFNVPMAEAPIPPTP